MPKDKDGKEQETASSAAEEQAEETAQEDTEESAEEKTEETAEEVAEETDEQQERSQTISRKRFDQVNEEKNALEKRLAVLEEKMADTPERREQQQKLINEWAERVSAQFGVDEAGTRKVTPDTVRAIAQISQDLGKRTLEDSDRDVRIHINIEKFAKANPDLKDDVNEYRDAIEDEVKTLRAESQVHPRAVEDAFWKLYGKGRKDAERKAMETGKEKGKQERKIVSSVKGESVSAGKSKISDYGSKLSEDEKLAATQFGISYKDYYESKGKKTIPRQKREPVTPKRSA